MFDEKMPACEDYDFFLRATLENKVKLIPLSLTIKAGGRVDQLSNQPGLDKYRIYALEKMLMTTCCLCRGTLIAIRTLEIAIVML